MEKPSKQQELEEETSKMEDLLLGEEIKLL